METLLNLCSLWDPHLDSTDIPLLFFFGGGEGEAHVTGRSSRQRTAAVRLISSTAPDGEASGAHTQRGKERLVEGRHI